MSLGLKGLREKNSTMGAARSFISINVCDKYVFYVYCNSNGHGLKNSKINTQIINAPLE